MLCTWVYISTKLQARVEPLVPSVAVHAPTSAMSRYAAFSSQLPGSKPRGAPPEKALAPSGCCRPSQPNAAVWTALLRPSRLCKVSGACDWLPEATGRTTRAWLFCSVTLLDTGIAIVRARGRTEDNSIDPGRMLWRKRAEWVGHPHRTDMLLTSRLIGACWLPDWQARSKLENLKSGRRSDLKNLQTVMLGIKNPDPRSKIQDFEKTFLGSMVEILDPDEVAGSKISGLDPRKVSWKSWILVLGSISHSDLSPDLSKTRNLKEMLVIDVYCMYYFSYIDWSMIPKSPQFWLWRKGT